MTPLPHDAEEILAQAAWARRLARVLVRDEHRADDLAQDALESGLRRRASLTGSVKSWLAGTLRNLNKEAIRGDRRRLEREARAAISESSDGAGEHVEKLEAQREMAEAVLRLPDTFRSAIFLRYYEERSLREVARSLGIGEKAAEARIYRALDLLRADLRKRFGTNLAAILAPLATPLLMTTQSKLAAIAVLILVVFGAIAGIEFLQGESAANATAAGPAMAAGSDPASRAEGRPAEAMPGMGEREGSGVQRSEVRSGVTLRVVDEAGAPIAGADIWSFERLGRTPVSAAAFTGPVDRQFGHRPPDARAQTDRDGRAWIRESAHEYQGVVYAKADGFAWRAMAAPGAETEMFRDLGDLVLARGGFLAFRVTDMQGAPVAGTLVSFQSAGPQDSSGTQTRQNLRTDDHGIVRFNSLPLGLGSVGISPPDYLPWFQEKIAVSEIPVLPREIQLDRAGSSQVHVQDADGHPVRGAEIYVFQFGRSTPPARLNRHDEVFLGETDAQGQRMIHGLTGDRSMVVLARSGPVWEEVRMEDPGTAATIRLPRARTLQARLRWADGSVVAGGLVTMIDTSREATEPDIVQTLGESGEFSIVLPEGLYGLAVWHADGSLLLDEAILLNLDRDLGTLELARGPALTFVVTDARTGLPLDAPGVAGDPGRGSILTPKTEKWKRLLTAAGARVGGFFATGNRVLTHRLTPGEHRLKVYSEGYLSKSVTVTVVAEREQEVSVGLMPEARLQLTVLDARGDPVGGGKFELKPEGLPEFWWHQDPLPEIGAQPRQGTTSAAGETTFASLEPGRWHLHRSDGDGLPSQPIASFTLEAGANVQTLRLPDSVRVELELLVNGTPLEGARIQFRELPDSPGLLESSGATLESDADGKAVFGCNAPGRFRLQISAAALLPWQQELEIGAVDQVLRIDFEGAELAGRIQGGSEDAEVVLIEFLSGDRTIEAVRRDLQGMFAEFDAGSWVTVNERLRYGFQRVGADRSFSMRGVAPGDYWLVARSAGWLLSEPLAVRVEREDVGGLVLTLQPAAAVIVEVTGVLEFRTAHPGVTLQFEYRSGGQSYRTEPALIGRDGQFVIRQAPAAAGTLVVTGYDDRGGRRKVYAEIAVMPREGSETQVSWDARSLLGERE